MKKFSIFILLVLTPFILNAVISPVTPELLDDPSPRQDLPGSDNGLEMSVIPSVQEQSEVEIEVTINNSSESIFGYGEFFYLEKKVDGLWYMLTFDDGVFKDFSAFDNYGQAIPPDETRTLEIDPADYSLNPDSGEYRIVKAFRYHDDTKVFWLTDEFKVV
ncbi:immunoglobulin-like domain-containing protein [Lacicoccus qingdaonensis]|uniref:Bacterial Ig-like domain-containing protein n=1 Tax=Lacicoccus qingdaonensis TaxID=576118 RepID=A0A1G9D805_9BACL|nr:immunoglobulin-like domain-containing protein [Salinicoccus qingdaonensis]SDK60050.1 hypothetical protein SAMN05216216_10589 [Salinicoccus qingdaonensis]